MSTAVATKPQSDIATTTRTRPASRKLRRLGLGAVLVACLGLALSACTPEQQLIDAINSSRASVGARALVPNATITFKAAAWSQFMASTNQLVHSNLASNNNLAWRALAENIGNFPGGWSSNDANNTFMNSPGHRANMLSGTYNYVGIGITFANGRMWVTEEFMLL